MRRRRKVPTAHDAPAAPGAPAAKPAPRVMSCCSNPGWVPELDLGSARGFDLMLGKCGACGTPWINAFCVAASIGGYEPVSPADAEAMRTITDPVQFKRFMRRWVECLA